MLLPSAFQCDTPRPRTTRLQASLLASPPASPPTHSLSSQTAFGNLLDTCHSLQALIASSPMTNDAPGPTELPTPPMSHAEPPPLKLRLRSRARAEDGGERTMPRKRIARRQPPRGANKRRRGDDDEVEDSNDDDYVRASELETSGEKAAETEAARPQTPKRARIAPEAMPLGLARRDYHDLHLQEQRVSSGPHGDENGGRPGAGLGDDEWTAEDDRILVELVLEKLRLTKSDWQDCARSLGKDKHSIGRRWKSLLVCGDVGLKTRSSRRARLHSTWR